MSESALHNPGSQAPTTSVMRYTSLALTGQAYRLGLLLAFVLGVFVRLFPVLTSDFPLNDGGLFFMMSEDLKRTEYALPEYTTYNDAQVPYAYSPLSFYLAAALSDVTSVDLLVIVRVLPAVLSCLTLAAFSLLARELLVTNFQVLLAVFAFAFIPHSFEWLIMGGGLTRALGLLFMLLTIRHAVLLYATGAKRHIGWTALWGGLTVLSHPGMAWVTVISSGVVFLFLGRNRRALMHSVLVVAGVGAFVLPWAYVVIEKHGITAFESATRTSSFFPLWAATLFNLVSLSGETVIQILLVTGYLGIFVCIAEKQYMLPIWLGSMLLLNPRSAPTDASILQALFVAIGIDRIILPAFTSLRVQVLVGRAGHARFNSSRLAHAILVLLLIYAFSTAVSSVNPRLQKGSALRPISDGDRNAMLWIAQAKHGTITPDSRFLLLTSADFWQIDAVLEWFPSLTGHKSITTVQGQEWLSGDRFVDLQKHYNVSRACAPIGLMCLEKWARASGFEFSHIYISKSPHGSSEPEKYFQSLEAELRVSPSYKLIFENVDVSIFAALSTSRQRISLVPGADDRVVRTSFHS